MHAGGGSSPTRRSSAHWRRCASSPAAASFLIRTPQGARSLACRDQETVVIGLDRLDGARDSRQDTSKTLEQVLGETVRARIKALTTGLARRSGPWDDRAAGPSRHTNRRSNSAVPGTTCRRAHGAPVFISYSVISVW
jgi:hypothetical protein